jgi:energy-coupling factor transporter ATP-binding protein EcfA2
VPRTTLPDRLEDLLGPGLITREILGRARPVPSPLAARITQLESAAAAAFAELVATPTRITVLDVDAAIGQFEVGSGLTLAPQQRQAVAAAAVDKCVVITGGPGVGKTTIVKAIVGLAARSRRPIALAAPTGRAAKRLAESTKTEAVTLHRLLEYQPQLGSFARDRDNPLDADVIVVDEVSMVDLALFHALVVAVRPTAQLILVGDIDQLPSVGAGAVLADVIASGAATVVRLTEIFRQAAQSSRIVTSAHQHQRAASCPTSTARPVAPTSTSSPATSRWRRVETDHRADRRAHPGPVRLRSGRRHPGAGADAPRRPRHRRAQRSRSRPSSTPPAPTASS